MMRTQWELVGNTLGTNKTQQNQHLSHHPQKKKKKLGEALGACWLTSLVVKNVKCLPLAKGLFKTLSERPYTFILGKKW
jgi:hypothetical protein